VRCGHDAAFAIDDEARAGCRTGPGGGDLDDAGGRARVDRLAFAVAADVSDVPLVDAGPTVVVVACVSSAPVSASTTVLAAPPMSAVIVIRTARELRPREPRGESVVDISTLLGPARKIGCDDPESYLRTGRAYLTRNARRLFVPNETCCWPELSIARA
jgi:hypothetical protein